MHPSNETTVGTVTVAGAASVVLLYIAGQVGIEMTEVVAGAFVVLGSAVVGLIRK
jgi:hypothetical protein